MSFPWRPAFLATTSFCVLATIASPAWAQPIPLVRPAGQTMPAEGSITVTARAPVPTGTFAGQAVSYLNAARRSLDAGRYAEARESLERAETRLIGGPAETATSERTVLDIGVARDAIGRRDRVAANRAIDDAIAATSQAIAVASAVPPPPVPPSPSAATAPPPQPPVTYALLPGHWRLDGWQYEWVPPETIQRRVDDRLLVQGHYIWRGGRWEWTPTRFGN
jgi:hypothetical protein